MADPREVLAFVALSTHLEMSAPTMPTAWPNKHFEETQETTGNNIGRLRPYQSVSFMPGSVPSTLVGFGQEENLTGIFQVSLYWPSDTGVVPAVRAAAQIAGYYPAGLVLVESGCVVRVNSPAYLSGALQETDRIQVPVTVPWIVLAT